MPTTLKKDLDFHGNGSRTVYIFRRDGLKTFPP